jgi:uncharacterized protein YndB with AHSA1/START domain
MPRNKDLKRLVRARMSKTGEAYTAARANILRKPTAPKPDYAALAGMSDAVIKAKTGCTWERWVAALDYHGATKLVHRDIAKLVSEKYKVPAWWTQAVTVGYERIKGLRAIGQRLDGTYEASKSRTFSVPVSVLFDAWAKPASRRRWLNGARVKVRTAAVPKSMRLDWADGGIVAVWFTPKGAAKSSVALAHTKLASKAAADGLKQYWSDRLDALGAYLGA